MKPPGARARKPRRRPIDLQEHAARGFDALCVDPAGVVREQRSDEVANVVGLADAAELATIAQAWRDWAADDDGWISLLHGELLIHV